MLICLESAMLGYRLRGEVPHEKCRRWNNAVNLLTLRYSDAFL